MTPPPRYAAYSTHGLRSQLEFAQVAMRLAQKPIWRAKNMKDIEEIKAEMARRGERVTA